MKYERLDKRSLNFAIKISSFYIELKNKKLYEIASQLFRSGTSIGANIAESKDSVSKKDFINKLSISLKEARETYYWLEILRSWFNYKVTLIQDECEELIKILVVVIKNLKKDI